MPLLNLQKWIIPYIIFFQWIWTIWLVYLNKRQIRVIRLVSYLPPWTNPIWKNKLDSLISFSVRKLANESVKEVYSCIMLTIALMLNIYGNCWKYAWGNNEYFRTATFILNLTIIQKLVESLPRFFHLIIYNACWSTIRLTIEMTAVQIFLQTVMTIPIAWLTVLIVELSPNYYHLYMMMINFFMNSSLIIMMAHIVVPISLQPLPKSSLKEKMTNLAKCIGFPLQDIYVYKDSAAANAFFTGIAGKHGIVLFEAILEGHTGGWFARKTFSVNEILAIVGHEMGHWYHSHVIKGLLFHQFEIFPVYLILSKLMNLQFIYKPFCLWPEKPIFPAFLIIMEAILSPLHFILQYLWTWASREWEFEADEYAGNLGLAADLCTALIKLAAASEQFPYTDPWYSAWHDSHPDISTRLSYLNFKFHT